MLPMKCKTLMPEKFLVVNECPREICSPRLTNNEHSVTTIHNGQIISRTQPETSYREPYTAHQVLESVLWSCSGLMLIRFSSFEHRTPRPCIACHAPQHFIGLQSYFRCLELELQSQILLCCIEALLPRKAYGLIQHNIVSVMTSTISANHPCH
jgi:hypothetical protein